MARILYVASTMEHITHFHSDYIRALKDSGHEVLVMAPDENADFNVEFEKKMLSTKNLKCQKKIKKIFKENRFDAVLLNTTLAAFNVRMALPRRNRPRVVNFVHGYMFSKKPSGLKEHIFLFSEKFVRSKTDAIIVMNSEDLEAVKKYRLTKGELLFVKGMGAVVNDPIEDAESIRERLDSKDSYVIAFTGEFRAVKNQKQLIEAFAAVKNEIPNAKLWLLGQGITKDECVQMTEDLGISDSVHFTGRVSNPTDYIRAVDLYVSPSRQEGLPFNVMEALGVAKPIIATELRGHRDLIEDGVTGLLYNKESKAELIEKILDVYNERVRFDKEKQLETYKSYSKDSIFDDTLNVMKRAMNVD